jgi:2-polyprenyl-3-methyl-5-hydroxy-6-metoxy-1,4-benzoquinol methylase
MTKPKLELLEDIATDHIQEQGFTPRLIGCRARAVNDALPQCENVLDLGCADGLLTARLADKHQRVVAVDASAIRVERTRKATAGRNVEVRQSYFEDFSPAAGERFDAVVLGCIIEHLDDPVALLSRCRDWLGDGGRVIAVVPNGRSVHRRAGVHMGLLPTLDALGEADDALDHKRVYTLDRLRDEFEAAGLRVEKTGGVLFKPLPNRKMAELSPELVDAYEALGRELPDLAAEIFAVGVAPG